MKSTSFAFSCLALSAGLLDGVFSLPSPPHSLQARQFGIFSTLGAATFDTSGAGACTDYKVISARGTSENQQHPTGNAGFISGLFKAVPGGANYEVVYPASVDYYSGPIEGSTDALKYITAQALRCPQQLYVLVGYSEGAMALTRLMTLPSVPASLIVAIVLYGNPYFKGGAPQNACSAKSGTGLALSTGLATQSLMPSTYSSMVFDCCLTGDMICQSIGTMFAHLGYPGSTYEKKAIAFAAAKLNAAL